MSSLENMKQRLNYGGGVNQQKRMIEDKLKSLKKSLLYSYQAETIVLNNGNNFRCLINPSKIKDEYDNKILSIPFEDICICKTITEQDEEGNNVEKDIPNKPDNKKSESFVNIDLKPGDVFKWKENNSYWLIHLQHLEELAYLRADIKKCNKEIEINNNKYKVYVRGSSVTKIDWTSRRNSITWNDLNYDLLMLVTNNSETNEFFHRFETILIDNLPYQIEAVDNISTDGIIQVALKETFKNTVEEEGNKEKEEALEEKKEAQELLTYKIVGDYKVAAYDTVEYAIDGVSIEHIPYCVWSVDNSKVQILQQQNGKVKLKINTGRNGKFILSCKEFGNTLATLEIMIKSL